MRLIAPGSPESEKLAFDASGHLTTERLARIIEVYARLPSTNDRLTRLARDGAVHGVTVVAMEQTAGRGQRGRTWHSPAGAGLYVSFLVRPTLTPRLAPTLTIAAGVALRAALAEHTKISLGIKWPNDLLVAERGPLYGRKLAGILVEASADQIKIDHAVIGMGINLGPTKWPAELSSRAVALSELGSPRPALGALVAGIANALERTLEVAEHEGLDQVAEDFTAHAVGRGEAVVVEADGARVEGILEGIAEDGALRLETAEGPRTLYRGDLYIPGLPGRER